jgi:Uma2 family endonuclease
MAMSVVDEQKLPADSGAVTLGRHRYLRAPVPLHFPSEAEVPESKLHLELRTLLYQVLSYAFAADSSIGCDQFVYFDASNPRACLSPDAFVRLGEPDSKFKSWKVWERGAPQLAVEIVSASDAQEEPWDIKFARYRQLGVAELVRFDPLSEEQRLRIWDRVENDLIERHLATPIAPSKVLPGYWLERLHPEHGPSLRLSHDAEGSKLYPTEAEAQRAEAESQRAEAESQRAEAESQRAKAEAARARVLELEAELARRQG